MYVFLKAYKLGAPCFSLLLSAERRNRVEIRAQRRLCPQKAESNVYMADYFSSSTHTEAHLCQLHRVCASWDFKACAKGTRERGTREHPLGIPAEESFFVEMQVTGLLH